MSLEVKAAFQRYQHRRHVDEGGRRLVNTPATSYPLFTNAVSVKANKRAALHECISWTLSNASLILTRRGQVFNGL